MDTLPLPPRPDLAQYRKRAKDLVAAARSKEDGAVSAWAAAWLETLARLLGMTVTPFVQDSFNRAVKGIERRVREKMADSAAAGSRFALADAQHLIAQAHGFDNWAAFASHLERPFAADSTGREFEAAVDAIVTGDLALLQSLIHSHPDLVRARSGRTHKATLLHYVAANGVEDYRQLTPTNAVAIARVLLEAGAEVDALAGTYGGGSDQTTMNLLVSSTHPAEAGLQAALVETLLDFGAAINGLDDDGSPMMTALAFGYRDAGDALARRGARIDNVVAAAGVGRADLVRDFVVDGRTLRPDVRLAAPRWWRLPNDPKKHIELALVWACRFGRTDVAEILLDKGVDPAARDADDMTALHWAAASGRVDLMRRLVEGGAPLEVKNTWGGTVLDSTVYFALNQPVAGADYPHMIEALIAAGADIRAVTPFPTGNATIDAVLGRPTTP